ncbi:hypothetical protein QOT17_002778 [Balamuthia mandrillaris]
MEVFIFLWILTVLLCCVGTPLSCRSCWLLPSFEGANASVLFTFQSSGCKENYVLNANGECSDECEHPNARLVGRNMCGFDCGSDVLLWHPFEDVVCTQCEANQYWSSEELQCLSCPEGQMSSAGSVGVDACVAEDSNDSALSSSSTDEDGSASGCSPLLPFFWRVAS